MDPSLAVDRATLAQALRVLARCMKGGFTGQSILRWDDGMLAIKLGGFSVVAPAAGDWSGQVRVGARFLLALASRLPAGDPVSVRVDDGRLYVGNFSAPCKWEQDTTTPIELPANVTLAMLLMLRLKYSDDEIERAGLAATLRAAEVERDALIQKAVAILAPLGIGAADLCALVERRISRERETL